MTKQVEINAVTLEQFKAKMVEANEFFKQLDQLTRQQYGHVMTYATINKEEQEIVKALYIKYGGSLD